MRRIAIIALSALLSLGAFGCVAQDEATDGKSELNDGQATDQSVLYEEEDNLQDDDGM